MSQSTFGDGCVDVNSHENEQQCPECKEWYEGLGIHWRWNPQHIPDYTKRQEYIIEGLMLGDGHLNMNGDNNSSIRVDSTNKKFIEWVIDEMGVLSTGNIGVTSGDDLHGYMEDCGIANEDSVYRDYYRTTIRSNPFLNKYESWYGENNGRKVMNNPSITEIDSITAKVWYISDGSISWSGNGNPVIRINSINLSGMWEDLIGKFDVPNLRWWSMKNNGYPEGRVALSSSSSRKFLEWIGEPIEGFEYKWELEDRNQYDYLKP